MRKSFALRSLLAGAASLLAVGAASAQNVFDQPYYAGGYAPAPGASYGGYGADVRVAPVRYEQG